MKTFIRKKLLGVLKIPPDPTPPSGSHASIRVFRAAPNYYRLLLCKWAIGQLGVVIGIIVSLSFLRGIQDKMNETVVFWIQIAEWVGIAGFILQVPVTLALLRFDYELRWYIVTDRSLRIRAGIYDVREMTMTFANIQQITVQQGPLQRMLGISDLMVRTAGGGSGGEEAAQGKGVGHMMHLGYFRGVNNAEEIRDLILERMKRSRDTGLGDPDESPEPMEEEEPSMETEAPAPIPVLAAAEELLQEVRQWRQLKSGNG